ncbi:hypothetical protein FRC19_005302 [Serendipita sp. 401]|nr:hypothetical protein FRC19_005302 [Serendipita sp. 401]
MGESLPAVAQLTNVTRWAHAAALALLCYDTLLTFQDEVKYIWSMNLSIIKVFIYGNRLLSFIVILIYVGPMVSLDRSSTNQYCQGIFIVTGVCFTVSFAMTNWIMLGRTKALLGGNRLYDTLLGIFYFGVLGMSVALIIVCLDSFISKTYYWPLLNMCGIVSRSKITGERRLSSLFPTLDRGGVLFTKSLAGGGRYSCWVDLSSGVRDDDPTFNSCETISKGRSGICIGPV